MLLKTIMSNIDMKCLTQNLAINIIQMLHEQELNAPLSMKHVANTADTWQHCKNLLGVLCIEACSF